MLTGVEKFVFTDGTVDNNDGSPLIDDLFYYAHNHDVWNAHVDADAHYNAIGWKEGRDPSAFFSTVGLSGDQRRREGDRRQSAHAVRQVGWKEGRIPSLAFDPGAYLAANPDVKAAGIDPLAHFLQFGAGEGRQPIAPTEYLAANGFDYVYYLQTNRDVVAAGVDPFQHFQTIGWKEGRNPNALFDTNGYLATYTDVQAANINPLDHYHQIGFKEGRDPSVGFDTTSYLSAYPDVAAANIDPLAHFLALRPPRRPLGLRGRRVGVTQGDPDRRGAHKKRRRISLILRPVAFRRNLTISAWRTGRTGGPWPCRTSCARPRGCRG